MGDPFANKTIEFTGNDENVWENARDSDRFQCTLRNNPSALHLHQPASFFFQRVGQCFRNLCENIYLFNISFCNSLGFIIRFVRSAGKLMSFVLQQF